MDDKPKDAKWLPAEDKAALDDILQKEQANIKPVKNYAAAFKSKAVILLCLQYATWSIGVYGFVLWLPSIIKAAPNMNIVKTGWLSSLPYAFAIIGMIITSYFSDKTLIRKTFIWPFLLVGAIAFYSSYLTGSSNFWLSFVLLVIAGASMYSCYGPFFAMLSEILPTNVLGGALALINSFGAVGAFGGSYLVGYLAAVTGNFDFSYMFMSGSLLISSILTIIAVKNTSVKIQRSEKKEIIPAST